MPSECGAKCAVTCARFFRRKPLKVRAMRRLSRTTRSRVALARWQSVKRSLDAVRSRSNQLITRFLEPRVIYEFFNSPHCGAMTAKNAVASNERSSQPAFPKKNGEPASNLVALDEWRDQIGRTSATIWRWRNKGWLTVLNISGRLYLTRSAIAKFEEAAASGALSQEHKTPKRPSVPLHTKAIQTSE